MRSSSNLNNFKALLRESIGDDTVTGFSKKSGISRQHLSKLLNSDVLPSKETLKKIVVGSSNKISIEDLYSACDYNYLEEKKMELCSINVPEEERAYSLAEDTKEKVLSVINGIRGWDNLDFFVYYIRSRFLSAGGDLEIIKQRKKYYNPAEVGAEYYALMSVTYDLEDIRVVVYFIITYCITNKSKTVILNAYFDARSFKELSELPKHINEQFSNLTKKALNSKLIYSFENNINFIDEYKRSVKIDPKHIEYVELIHGLGFYVKNISTSDLGLFFKHHKSTFLNNGYGDIYNSLSRDDSFDLNLISHFEDKDNAGKGLFFALSYIMSKESGFDFVYYSGVNLKGNIPCIMIDVNASGENRQMIESVLKKYAKELNLEKYETCFYQVYDRINIESKAI